MKVVDNILVIIFTISTIKMWNPIIRIDSLPFVIWETSSGFIKNRVGTRNTLIGSRKTALISLLHILLLAKVVARLNYSICQNIFRHHESFKSHQTKLISEFRPRGETYVKHSRQFFFFKHNSLKFNVYLYSDLY